MVSPDELWLYTHDFEALSQVGSKSKRDPVAVRRFELPVPAQGEVMAGARDSKAALCYMDTL